ncbi:hypothetical protein B0H13DRAFT_2654477 [Mycena leptocephala]|nr:hypothetical protein B0H13DRAFT_2654477 [Mycena leptocephala]
MLIDKRRRSWLLRRSITSGVVSTDLGTPLRIFRLSIPASTLLVEPLTRLSTSRKHTHTPRSCTPRVVHSVRNARRVVPPVSGSRKTARPFASKCAGLQPILDCRLPLPGLARWHFLFSTACFRFARSLPLLDGSDSAYGHEYRYPCAALVLGDLLRRTRSFLGFTPAFHPHSETMDVRIFLHPCGGGARGPSLVEEMSLSLSPFYDNHPTSSTPLRIRMYLARPRLRSVGLAREPAPRCAPPFACVLCASYPGPSGHAFPVRAIIISRPSASRAFQGSLRAVSPTPDSSPAAGGPRSACGCCCAREVLKAQGVVCVRVWYPIGVSYMQATSGWRKREGEGDAERSYCADVLRSSEGGRAASMESGHRLRYHPWGVEWAGDWRYGRRHIAVVLLHLPCTCTHGAGPSASEIVLPTQPHVWPVLRRATPDRLASLLDIRIGLGFVGRGVGLTRAWSAGQEQRTPITPTLPLRTRLALPTVPPVRAPCHPLSSISPRMQMESTTP